MSFVIRTGIAIPTKTRAIGANSKFPLRDLQVGQSFFIPNASKATGVSLSKLAKGLDIAITTRRCEDFESYDEEGNGVGEKVPGLAVWRVEPKAAA